MSTVARLAALLGEDRVVPVDANDPVRRVFPAGAHEPCVARPTSIEEVSEIVALAHADGLCVLPRGGGTRGLPFVATRPVDVVVELSGLSRIVEHTPEDMVASVECGIGVDACQRALREKGQWVPVDTPLAPTSTVGGLLATDASGPRGLRHGTLRDWVIGTTLVRFDGRPVRAGGMVVKNVTGYDLSKLYIGSHGTLGVLVRANFKLAPLPEVEGLMRVDAADRERAARIAARVFEARLPLDTAAWLTEPRALLLGLAGERAVVDGRRARLEALLGEEPALGFRWVEGDERDALRQSPARVQDAGSNAWVVKIQCAPANHVALMRAVEQHLDAGNVRECSLPGAGISWLGWAEPPSDPGGLVETLRPICAAAGGRLETQVPHAWSIAEPELAVMRRLKSSLDPTGTFVDGPLPAETTRNA
jgi:glycolate oxidase FAD binding subunit